MVKKSRRIIARRARGARRTRQTRRQRGGARYKQDILDAAQGRRADLLEYLASMETPTWHTKYPAYDGMTYYLLFHDGQSLDDVEQKLLLVTMTKDGDGFSDVYMQTYENAQPAQMPGFQKPEVPPGGTISRALREASDELFGIAGH